MAKRTAQPADERQDDPLAQALRPPADESPEQRQQREQEQREATRVSLQIDEGIQEARKAFERRKRAVKILLLGASQLTIRDTASDCIDCMPRSSRVWQEYDAQKYAFGLVRVQISS